MAEDIIQNEQEEVVEVVKEKKAKNTNQEIKVEFFSNIKPQNPKPDDQILPSDFKSSFHNQLDLF